ncbi:hypothetical protein [Actinokineospora sp. NBRC 105648]|uniref:hypothetical protein n=1 Tax=Actinokineospora sp. NBRC 105648 TaxID=3032206 RepID=UPI0024A0685D|nr:hypothetical protein [Actinokineospora sp. NBRC 105648]GLZ40340.1 hypothetical protein Acsp05_39640 [Actinokineospora sp. NBRC 105648]
MRPVRITGLARATSGRPMGIARQAEATCGQPARITGLAGATSRRPIRITRRRRASSRQPTRITGPAWPTDRRPMGVARQAGAPGRQPARITGQTGSNSGRPARVTRQSGTTSRRPARVGGLAGNTCGGPVPVSRLGENAGLRPVRAAMSRWPARAASLEGLGLVAGATSLCGTRATPEFGGRVLRGIPRRADGGWVGSQWVGSQWVGSGARTRSLGRWPARVSRSAWPLVRGGTGHAGSHGYSGSRAGRAARGRRAGWHLGSACGRARCVRAAGRRWRADLRFGRGNGGVATGDRSLVDLGRVRLARPDALRALGRAAHGLLRITGLDTAWSDTAGSDTAGLDSTRSTARLNPTRSTAGLNPTRSTAGLDSTGSTATPGTTRSDTTAPTGLDTAGPSIAGPGIAALSPGGRAGRVADRGLAVVARFTRAGGPGFGRVGRSPDVGLVT